MKLRTIAGALFALVLACQQALAAATLLPNGEQCFQATTGINGMVGTIGALTVGSGGATGTYAGVPLTGGSGANATANITVSGGGVTAVTILNPGSQFVVGDVLSALSTNIGGVTGFSVPVASISINSSMAGGSVTFYQPNTNIFKSTWFNADAATTHQNTNPVQLDANGCAIIYGTGMYRQVLKDSIGDTVWDQITTDTSANNNTFWAGIAAGTPNVITVINPGFNGTDGSIINFTANATNTTSATLNPSGFGAVPILKNTTSGPVSLIGGEIIQNNQISVIYSAVANSFNLLNPPIQSASGSSAPLCGAVGYSASNSLSLSNSLNLAASSAVMVSPAGQAINRSNVSLVLNFNTNGPNGLDTGAIAGSSIYYVYLIDNGSAAASLASLSSTSPTMPSGYTFKCRLSAVPTTSIAVLFPIQTFGRTTTIPGFISGVTSTTATGGTCFSSYVAFAVPFVPPTAQYISGNIDGTGSTEIGVAAGGASSALAVGSDNVAGQVSVQQFTLATISAQNVFYCNNSTSNQLSVTAWTDAVNAN